MVSTSSKIWGGLQFTRGFLLGNATKRRAVRGEDGLPVAGGGRPYEPGDFIIDLNTGRQIKVKARCAPVAAAAWVASTGRIRGDIIRPSVNNARDRALVCTAEGASTSGAEPNWNGTADNATIADGTATWTVWGTTGSGVAQFDIPLDGSICLAVGGQLGLWLDKRDY